MSERVIETYADAGELAVAAGARLVGAITSAIAARDVAHIVLTGGTVGIAMLRHVAGAETDWSKVQLFWGDDRFVPRGHADRNDQQAHDALLASINIPAENVHRMATSDGEFGDAIEDAAAAYAELLPEQFDVHLLGMGGEGHINSLFPHTPAVRETSRLVLAVTDSPKPPPRRITLTLPAIGRSREVWLIVAGAEKADATAAAIGGASAEEIPAAGAVGQERTVWLLDEAAAAKLPARG